MPQFASGNPIAIADTIAAKLVARLTDVSILDNLEDEDTRDLEEQLVRALLGAENGDPFSSDKRLLVLVERIRAALPSDELRKDLNRSFEAKGCRAFAERTAAFHIGVAVGRGLAGVAR
jgi:hypothetical protein